MRVRFLKEFRGVAKGHDMNVSDDVAESWEELGIVEILRPTATPAPAASFADAPPDNKAIDPEQVKRKGGWPKGKPRRAPVEAIAAQ